MSKESRKGTSFERLVADYLKEVLNAPDIDRRCKIGERDRGDIGGVYLKGSRVVVECKNHVSPALPSWLNQAEQSRINDGAEFAVVVHKRKGKSHAKDQYVTMTLETLAAIIAGKRSLMNIKEK